MNEVPEYQPFPERSSRRRLMPLWGWVLLCSGLFVVLMCSGILGFLMYVGIAGPETKVYIGNRVPARFAEVMKVVGALEEGERIDFFYSDAFIDIRNGFYFVSDRGVAVYSREFITPLTKVGFEQIVDASLSRNESFFIDSEIILELTDGTYLAFPVSSEEDGDVRFFDTITSRMTGGAAAGSP